MSQRHLRFLNESVRYYNQCSEHSLLPRPLPPKHILYNERSTILDCIDSLGMIAFSLHCIEGDARPTSAQEVVAASHEL